MTQATATETHHETGLYDLTNLAKMKTLGTHAQEALDDEVLRLGRELIEIGSRTIAGYGYRLAL